MEAVEQGEGGGKVFMRKRKVWRIAGGGGRETEDGGRRHRLGVEVKVAVRWRQQWREGDSCGEKATEMPRR